MGTLGWLLVGIFIGIAWKFVVPALSAVIVVILALIAIVAELVIYLLSGPMAMWQWLTKPEKHYK